MRTKSFAAALTFTTRAGPIRLCSPSGPYRRPAASSPAKAWMAKACEILLRAEFLLCGDRSPPRLCPLFHFLFHLAPLAL
jgi:hypothetical protein